MPEENIGQLTAQLGADISEMRRNMNRAEQLIKDYGKTTDRRLGAAEARWRRYGRRVGTITKGLKTSVVSLKGAMAGMAGALILGDTIRKGAQFEQTLTEVKGISQATGAEFKAMSAAAREMGETTEWSASQAGEGLKFLSMAGFEAREATEALPGVLDLATAGNIELGRAADIASNALTAMQLDVEELGKVNDTFVKTITSSNTNMEMMAESFKYAGSVGNSFGYEIEEISAMVGQLGNAGIQGSMAGTQLAMAFQKADEVFEEYGVNAEKSKKYTDDLVGAMQLLEDRGADASKVMDIFGQRAGRGVAALLGQGVDSLTDYIKRVEQSEGASEKLAETMRSTTIGRFKELKSVIESVQIDLFRRQTGSLNQTLEDLTNYVRDNRDAIINFVDSLVEGGKVLFRVFKELAKGVGMAWKILSAVPLGVINYFENVEAASKEAREDMEKTAKELENMQPDPTPWQQFTKFLANWGRDIIDLFALVGKNIGNMFAVMLKDTWDFIINIGKGFKNLGEIIMGALTFDTDRIKAGWGELMSMPKDLASQWQANWDAYVNSAYQSWEQYKASIADTHGWSKASDAAKNLASWQDDIDKVPAGIGRTVEELKRMDKWEKDVKESLDDTTGAQQKQVDKFKKVIQSLKDERRQILMTEKQWAKYQAVQRAGEDVSEEQVKQIHKRIEALYELRRAQEYDKKAGAPAGIGPGRAGADDQWAKDQMEKSEEIGNKWDETYDRMANAFDGWANQYSSKLNDMLWESELTFDGILESFGKMITEMLIQSAASDITGALFKGSGDSGSDKAGWLKTAATTVMDLWSQSAQGNVFDNGRQLNQYAAGGIVNRPTLFPMANGAGLMGEAGPEAIMPLTRTRGGKLGVASEGGQGGRPQYNNFNVTVQAPEGNLSKESQRQLKRRLSQSVDTANRRVQ